MIDAVLVTLPDIAGRRDAARHAILAADLPRAVHAGAPGPYGATAGALALLEALEGAFATGLAAGAAVRARIARDRAAGFAAGELTPAERRFVAALGVLVACEEALATTASGPPVPDKPFAPDAVVAVLQAADFTVALAGDLRGFIDHYAGHADAARRLGDDARLTACARSHLARMARAARAVVDDAEHAPLRDALAAAPLTLPGVSFAGSGGGGPLERLAAEDDEQPDLADVAIDDIVGNQDVLQAAMKLARAVASFDLAAGKNPRTIDNPVLFVLGSPGCGKTMTAHAVGHYFLGLCREAGIPGRFRVIRRTDWASHYQNKSASDLLRVFRDDVFGFHGVCGCYWPDIDTAFAARSDPDIRAEEKANLAALFGILDGTVGPRNGKWFLIADANYMQMDDAMVSRLTQDPKIARGPETAADYVRLLRDVKLRRWQGLLPPEADWERIGARLAEAKLSGRAVAAVAGRVGAELEDVEEPPDFLRLSYEDKVAALRARARPIAAERVLAHIEHYLTFERDAADRAARERFERRVGEIRLHLSAQAAALGT